jgi:hypothetical protein
MNYRDIVRPNGQLRSGAVYDFAQTESTLQTANGVKQTKRTLHRSRYRVELLQHRLRFDL